MLDGRIPTHTVRRPDSQLSILAGAPPSSPPPFLIQIAESQEHLDAYQSLRHAEFVERQGLFSTTDRDDTDDDPRTTVLVATAPDGTVLGGVRVAPCTTVDIGWWAGSRLVTTDGSHAAGAGSSLVRAACAFIEAHDVLRFDAMVQDRYARLFARLGWSDQGPAHTVNGRAHREMTWPIARIQAQTDATKAVLHDALAPFAELPGGLGPAGFRGDDGVPLPDSDMIAACDAIIPSMVERDPEWAGWCSVLVNLNDLTAMGARPVGMLDAVGAPTTAHLDRIISGIADAARAWRTPVLGGHTQVGVPCALSVTAVGRAASPVGAGGGRPGDAISILADLSGSWRPGYHGLQWDSTSRRTSEELAAMSSAVGRLQPAAAKDVSMAGLVGTVGMLAEASGTGAELDVASIPRPQAARMGSWLTCFPGYAMVLADRAPVADVAGPLTATPCGQLTQAPGVRLRWPDGRVTTGVAGPVSGLGAA